LCLAYAKMNGQGVAIGFQQYVAQVSEFLADDVTDTAYLWDRVGHWAQVDGEWEQAEDAYRKAYSKEPDRYGYCLGTSLNFLGRHRESLPILLEQATIHQPNAMSWFQVAVAQEGIGAIDECKESYLRAIALDPDYEAAIFNLGGIYWNHGPKDEAIRIWRDAIKRFPSHALAEKLRSDLAQVLDLNGGE
jgi:tetratricopeptide (TPR) repeat protein